MTTTDSKANKRLLLTSCIQLIIVSSLSVVIKCQQIETTANSQNNNKENSNYHFLDEFGTTYSTSVSSNDYESKATSSPASPPNLLLDLKLGKDIFTPEQFDAVTKSLYEREELDGTITLAEYGLMGLVNKVLISPYTDLQLHHYDTYGELRESGGPEANQELCLRQLNYLINASQVERVIKYNSTNIRLHEYFDTFGRVPAGFMEGDLLWLGDYEECLRLEIKLPAADSLIDNDNELNHVSASQQLKPTKLRYCLASMVLDEWSKKKPISDFLAIKLAVCLPKACDSNNYKNKYKLLRELQNFGAKELDLDTGDIVDLYCLPDAESSLTIWWRNPKTLATVLGISIWLLLLTFSTIKCYLSTKNKHINDDNESNEKVDNIKGGVSMTKGFEKVQVKDKKIKAIPYFKIYQSLSITNNLKLLFDTTKESSLLKAGDELQSANQQQQGKKGEQVIHTTTTNESTTKKLIDFNVLEGIKVICMTYVVMGHILMCISPIVRNGFEFITASTPAFYLANMTPSFAVNSFFTITGLLTSYLLLKQNKKQSFIMEPLKWFAFFIYRYLRIMPIYALAVVYAKYLANYASSGPLWDYGTSSLAHRKTCINESWWWTLLFGANFKSPLKHCIVSAWYLANDFQFFLITPIYLSLLHKSPRIGQLVLKVSILAGYFAGFTNIFLNELHDFRPIAYFMPHGFTTYVTFLHANYTQPQYRIPAYLCGLLFGYQLFEYEEMNLNYLANKSNKLGEKKVNSENQAKNQEETEELSIQGEKQIDHLREKLTWSKFFINYGTSISISLIALCISLSKLTPFVPLNKLGARFACAMLIPLLNILFSLSIGLYILLASTGYGNKWIKEFLSASFWKPLARLSLCVVLINMDVITYVIQSMRRTQHVDAFYHFSLNVSLILLTYLIAIVVCVLFEAPLRALLNQLLALVISQVALRMKKAESVSAGTKQAGCEERGKGVQEEDKRKKVE